MKSLDAFLTQSLLAMLFVCYIARMYLPAALPIREIVLRNDLKEMSPPGSPASVPRNGQRRPCWRCAEKPRCGDSVRVAGSRQGRAKM